MKQKILILLSLLALSSTAPAAESYTNAYEAIALFTQVLDEVRRRYVDSDEATYDERLKQTKIVEPQRVVKVEHDEESLYYQSNQAKHE